MDESRKSPEGGRARLGLSPELSKPIRLTRTFFVMTLVIVALVLAVQSWLYADWLQSDILENSKNNAVRIARHIHFQIENNFRPAKVSHVGLGQSHDSKKNDGSDPGSLEEFDPALIDLDQEPEVGAFGVLDKDELKQLDSLVQNAITKQEILNVYIFDRQRHITYSTNSGDVGFDLKENKYYDLALKGMVSSVLVERGSPVDISHRRFGVVLLETYVPIESKTGQFLGVIEIYQDASEIKNMVQRGLLHIGLVSVAGFAILTIGLWFIVHSAHRHLDTRTTALISTNQELSELSQNLEEQVQERGRQLSRAETLAGLGTLAAGVAHEINNPIATIASCAEGLLRKEQKNGVASRKSGSRQIQYLELIKDEAYRVKGITRNLLDFSRPGANQHEAMDLREPLKAIMTILEFRVEKAGITLEFEYPDEDMIVLGDSNALRQLFLNITINALDASESGSKIQWTLEKTDDAMVAACRDQGSGIGRKQLDKVLEPFYTTKESGKGTGLGLSISHNIVEQHSGTLDVQSIENEGTTIILRFPIVDSLSELIDSKRRRTNL
jgi:two-component system, NtrC family, sensor kinase